MQLLKDPKSSSTANDDSVRSRDANSSNRPSRDLMCLVFPDGTVRTIDPEADDD